MTPLLRQFLDEGRGLVQEATRDLLGLEREPGDAGRATAVFRAFHTLKGSAGLFDVAPMTRMLHAAEDALAGVRDGRAAVDARLVDALLACLDQTGRWLDALEAAGALPAAAESEAGVLVGNLAAALGEGPPPAAPAPAAPRAETGAEAAGALEAAGFDEAERAAALDLLRGAGPGAALFALRHEPRRGAFFDGEDPIRRFRDLPGLAALRVEAAGEPGPLDAFDPFACALVFRALVVGEEETVRAPFRLVPDEVSIARVATPVPPAPAPAASAAAAARAILAEQARLLDMPGCPRPELPGRIGSAATAAANALLHEGRRGEADAVLAAAAAALQAGDPAPLSAAIRRVGAGATPPAAGAPPAHEAPEPAPEPIAAPASRVLRVDEAKVDHLLRLVGEMVVAKNGLGWIARSAGNAEAGRLHDLHSTLDRLTREMQDAVLRIRMLPLAHAFERFPRLVRDLSGRLGKPARLVVEGEREEADKAIVERLSEPVLHLVRNALDHGVEPAGERAAAGKPETATIVLRGFRGQGRDQGRIVVEVADDGRGIDVAAVRRKALARGLLDPERDAALVDEDAMQMVFAPGLSTAEGVSDLSGRGVGMDAVRAAVEATGGSVSIRTSRGEGTTVRLSLPLTLSSVRLMTVVADGRRLGVPMDAVAETALVPRDAVRRVKGREVFSLRGRVVPLVGLARLLGLDGERPPGAAGAGDARVLVVEVDGQPAGVEVDGFGERLDAMLKPMDGLLSGIRGYLGTTLLGSGEVLLVLDLREMLR